MAMPLAVQLNIPALCVRSLEARIEEFARELQLLLVGLLWWRRSRWLLLWRHALRPAEWKGASRPRTRG